METHFLISILDEKIIQNGIPFVVYDTCFLSKTSIVMSYPLFKSDAENAHICIT